ncbi:LPS assembly lipoprotein LptE [Pseudovibrio sp. SPO723]|uniref:LPS assembly lipoprotein LptE n=1 Tax=Nesiotobacter zosterae TaxID=392721 RepID=UPI0029C3D1C6|nr:LPS assembly lipoprotein LptE [Pseudovibrio sp. SPO723]MDX5595131.1 LPS assembly lipoprotein LptE [Pseudovibrio sp. SPO723]
MSLFDLKAQTAFANRRALLGGVAVVASALLLAGCQVRPLYGVKAVTLTADGQEVETSVQQQLASIDVEVADIGGESLSRVNQFLRNELLFNLRRGGDGLPTQYRIKILVNKIESEVGVEELADVPSAYNLTLNASFILSDAANEKTLYTGRSFASASYDFSSQRFANLRAERDAEDRAAKVVAADIQARLAGYFASQI